MKLVKVRLSDTVIENMYNTYEQLQCRIKSSVVNLHFFI